eukprot:TRINITY_DN24354_c0_g1_i1.p1 TRINITY_DN24354_c0_g1~~TRINITY_DN24354_c0_g1_i1.p1  ORF type:complete len:368 (-),score=76.16 TRINITY_DN24354_c0_g1_i1:292-1311(-)
MPPAAEFHALRCNWSGSDGHGCDKLVDDNCWITSCKHILCFEHAKAAFESSDSCPVCNVPGTKVVRANLSRNSRARLKGGALAGLAPTEIMSCMTGALDFWISQKALEVRQRAERCQRLEQREKAAQGSLKEQLAAIRRENAELEAEQAALQKKIEAAEDERAKVNSRAQGLRRELAEAEEQYSQLRGQNYAKPTPGSAARRSTASFAFQGAAPSKHRISFSSPSAQLDVPSFASPTGRLERSSFINPLKYGRSPEQFRGAPPSWMQNPLREDRSNEVQNLRRENLNDKEQEDAQWKAQEARGSVPSLMHDMPSNARKSRLSATPGFFGNARKQRRMGR